MIQKKQYRIHTSVYGVHREEIGAVQKELGRWDRTAAVTLDCKMYTSDRYHLTGDGFTESINPKERALAVCCGIWKQLKRYVRVEVELIPTETRLFFEGKEEYFQDIQDAELMV
jgi:hypothetical protein